MEEKRKGFVDRLRSGDVIIAAEGYLLELNRRGYNSNSDFIPRAVLDNIHKVEELTREFVHAGSDVCSAFVYYATKNQLDTAGEGDNCELINRKALDMARRVARETETYFTAGIAKTGHYDPNNNQSNELCRQEYQEQMGMAAEYGVDFIHVQTMWDYGEASIALQIAKEHDLPAIITLAPSGGEPIPKTFDGYELADALQRLLDQGAACVGLNCSRGPKTMIPIMKELRQKIKGPLACLANGYHTNENAQTWYHLKDPETGQQSFPYDLSSHYIADREARWYAEQLKEIGMQYVGFCCGNNPIYTRTLAMAYGRNPPAAKYAKKTVEERKEVPGFQLKRHRDQLSKYLGVANKSG